jgi:hypothetical protein
VEKYLNVHRSRSEENSIERHALAATDGIPERVPAPLAWWEAGGNLAILSLIGEESAHYGWQQEVNVYSLSQEGTWVFQAGHSTDWVFWGERPDGLDLILSGFSVSCGSEIIFSGRASDRVDRILVGVKRG